LALAAVALAAVALAAVALAAVALAAVPSFVPTTGAASGVVVAVERGPPPVPRPTTAP
jgi:hypothetical protein